MAGGGSVEKKKGLLHHALSKKGSLHVMHKTTGHTTDDIHDAHVPPHLRL
jgi:hypothetical protein